MMQGLQGGEALPITAYDFDTREKVGDFDSIGSATRKLFIKSKSAIWGYLYGWKNSTFGGKKRGVESSKTGKKYHFEVTKK